MRKAYNSTYDATGSVGKENLAIKSFWSKHKVIDVMQLTPEELDAAIAIWIEEYQAHQIKRKKGWWYPIHKPLAQ